MKKLVILAVVVIALALSVLAISNVPDSTTEPIVTDIDTTTPVSIDENDTVIITVSPTATIIKPTPVSTLESMRNARMLSNGEWYPNYKVAPIVVDKG